jgi:hypothetical protein
MHTYIYTHTHRPANKKLAEELAKKAVSRRETLDKLDAKFQNMQISPPRERRRESVGEHQI